MRLSIEATEVLTTVDGSRVRLWRGTTEGGRPCDVFVARVGADDDVAQAELERALAETGPPHEVAFAEAVRRAQAGRAGTPPPGAYVPVPVGAAEHVARQFFKAIVIIAAWDATHDRTHLTTFGVTARDKLYAAMGGDIVAKALLGDGLGNGGGDFKTVSFEDFRGEYEPALFKEACDLLRLVVGDPGVIRLLNLEAVRRARDLLGAVGAKKGGGS